MRARWRTHVATDDLAVHDELGVAEQLVAVDRGAVEIERIESITLRGITWMVARTPAPSLTSSTCASAKCPLASASAIALRTRTGVTRSPGRISVIAGGRTSGQRLSSSTTSTATSGEPEERR